MSSQTPQTLPPTELAADLGEALETTKSAQQKEREARDREQEAQQKAALLSVVEADKGLALLRNQNSIGMHWIARSLERTPEDSEGREELLGRVAEAAMQTPRLVSKRRVDPERN